MASSTQIEADYRRLFALSLDLLCIAGADGYFKQVNPAWTQTLGWSEEELLSRPVKDFMHPDDRERTLQARQVLLKGVPLRGLENRYLCKDGSYRWLSWQSVTAPDRQTVYAVARDITERRQKDQEQLVRNKLEATGILAGGIAHDFNNLLAGLLLNLEMIGLCGETSDEQNEHIRHAESTVHTAKALAEQLITFSDGGMMRYQMADVRKVLQSVVDTVLSGSQLRADYALAEDLPLVEVDVGQISQVVRNIVLNAREAAVADGLIRVHAERVELEGAPDSDVLPGDYLRISIADDGPGIPSEIIPKVFDPYFSTKRRAAQKGMGLGLTICRSIVQKHGGTISIRSHEGKGTAVMFHLPAHRSRRTASAI